MWPQPYSYKRLLIYQSYGVAQAYLSSLTLWCVSLQDSAHRYPPVLIQDRQVSGDSKMINPGEFIAIDDRSNSEADTNIFTACRMPPYG